MSHASIPAGTLSVLALVMGLPLPGTAQTNIQRIEEISDPHPASSMSEHQSTLPVTNDGSQFLTCRVTWRYRNGGWMSENVGLDVYLNRAEQSPLSRSTRGGSEWSYECDQRASARVLHE
jgi:hypothetical protein